MEREEFEEFGNQLNKYCEKYNIPTEYLFEILEDQKVIPMIRGKGLEYNAYLKLREILPSNIWDVQKLNLNAQTGTTDEDISITHRRSGIILKIECKSGVRGSIRAGIRTRKLRVPHFKVKCHRSRSSIKLASTSNDRYAVDEFDLIITNTSNSIYEGGTVGENLEITYNEPARAVLNTHYGVTDDLSLIRACDNDWRFCIPSDIAEEGFIPRTPYVRLNNDENWQDLSNLNYRLQEIVVEKNRQRSGSSRRN
ncbi:MAG: hypothetical protein QM485_05015 [Flavobacteriaceae bacterium]